MEPRFIASDTAMTIITTLLAEAAEKRKELIYVWLRSLKKLPPDMDLWRLVISWKPLDYARSANKEWCLASKYFSNSCFTSSLQPTAYTIHFYKADENPLFNFYLSVLLGLTFPVPVRR